mmetsp:Transcript_38330/g.120668  ORF Transcript_38330/g.120668 Transcript_38330/m.120668 type:complete len:256 (+) Transcript_38330:1335-2102(+)
MSASLAHARWPQDGLSSSMLQKKLDRPDLAILCSKHGHALPCGVAAKDHVLPNVLYQELQNIQMSMKSCNVSAGRSVVCELVEEFSSCCMQQQPQAVHVPVLTGDEGTGSLLSGWFEQQVSSDGLCYELQDRGMSVGTGGEGAGGGVARHLGHEAGVSHGDQLSHDLNMPEDRSHVEAGLSVPRLLLYHLRPHDLMDEPQGLDTSARASSCYARVLIFQSPDSKQRFVAMRDEVSKNLDKPKPGGHVRTRLVVIC